MSFDLRRELGDHKQERTARAPELIVLSEELEGKEKEKVSFFGLRKREVMHQFFFLVESHTKNQKRKRPNLFFFLSRSSSTFPQLSRVSKAAQMAFCIKILKWTISLATVRREEEERKRKKASNVSRSRGEREREELPTSSTPTLIFSPTPPSTNQQVAGAGAVAGITALKLQKVTVDSSGVSLGASCYLWDQAGQSNPNQACVYAYTVAGVSLAAALAVSLLQCFTCNLCGLGDWADALFEGAAAAWWGEECGLFCFCFPLEIS